MVGLKIRRVGNSLGVILPKEIQEFLNIQEGDTLDVNTVDSRIVLESHLPHHSRWKFKDAQLNNEDKEWLDADLGVRLDD